MQSRLAVSGDTASFGGVRGKRDLVATSHLLESVVAACRAAAEWAHAVASAERPELEVDEEAEERDRLERAFEEYLEEQLVEAELEEYLRQSAIADFAPSSDDDGDYCYDGISDYYDL